MSKFIKQLVTIVFLSTLLACAGTSAPTDRDPDRDVGRRTDCIREPSIRGYTVLDEKNLIVDATGRRSYLVTLFSRAYNLDSSWQIGFRSRMGDVCAGFSDLVYVGNFDGEYTRISSIREITPEEKEDLLIQFGKKEPEIEQTPEPQEVEGADVEELDTAAGD